MMLWLKYLNACGIVLNLLAGFMLAPELLGINRLRKTEIWLERFSQEISRKLPVAIRKLNEAAVNNDLKEALEMNKVNYVSYWISIVFMLAILVTEIFVPHLRNWPDYFREGFAFAFNDAYRAAYTGVPMVIVWLPYYLAGAWAIGLIYLLVWTLRLHKRCVSIKESLEVILTAVFAPFTVPMFIFSTGLQLLLFVIIRLGLLAVWLFVLLIQKFLSRFLKRLEGEEGLAPMLVGWGITLFIVGNILQFIAAIVMPVK